MGGRWNVPPLARNEIGWRGANQKSTPAIANTPTIWTTTLVLFSSATSRTPKWLIRPCTTRVNANIRNTWLDDGEIPRNGSTN